jgi:glycosyltransferase involved in cell wall biosynthesis
MEKFFSVSEKNQDLECEGVKVHVLRLDTKAQLLLKPVFKLIWRKSTFPLARWLYVAAMRGQIVEASRGVDVLHYFGNGPEMLGFAAEAAARKIGAKFVIEPALHEGQWGDKWFDAILYKRADLLLAHTRHEAGVLERMGISPSKIRTIVHGVDFCDSGDGERFLRKHGIAGPVVLFLGRKTKEKGVERLLNAWPGVAEKFPEATLVIAGPKSADFEKLKAEMRNSDEFLNPQSAEARTRILNLDNLPEGEKQDALAACDLLCVPSEGESFGMVYFEAWFYKKPVVALDLPVLRETVGNAKAGLLVRDDYRNVADGICELLHNPHQRSEMGERGCKFANEHEWTSSAKSYEFVYGKLSGC